MRTPEAPATWSIFGGRQGRNMHRKFAGSPIDERDRLRARNSVRLPVDPTRQDSPPKDFLVGNGRIIPPPAADQRRISDALTGRLTGAARLTNVLSIEVSAVDALPAALPREAFEDSSGKPLI